MARLANVTAEIGLQSDKDGGGGQFGASAQHTEHARTQHPLVARYTDRGTHEPGRRTPRIYNGFPGSLYVASVDILQPLFSKNLANSRLAHSAKRLTDSTEITMAYSPLQWRRKTL